MQGSAGKIASFRTLIRHAGVILAAVILIAFATFSNVTAAGKGHLAPDLVEKLKKGSPGETVRLVLSPAAGADIALLYDRAKAHGADIRGEFRHVRLVVLDMPLGEVEAFSQELGVDYLSPDRPVGALASHLQTTTGASNVYPTGNWLVNGGGWDGQGIGVAIIDSGVDSEHSDLRDFGTRRVIASYDFVGSGSLDDPYGHGTHIAGIIAGNGYSGLQVGVDYAGIAPRANIINLRVLDNYGHGYLSNVIAAIDYTIANRKLFNIRVVNLSLSAPPVDSYKNDPLCQAVERATKAGLVVVVAAGNFGVDAYGNKQYGSITSPANSPAAITIGATNTQQTNYRSDDTMAPYSSRGPTMSHTTDPVTGTVVYDRLAKPDLVAPGFRVVALERYQNYIVTNHPTLHVDVAQANNHGRYMKMHGTSMSAGVVSGAVALMLQANPSLTPNQVKAILMYTAQMMNGPDLFEQGAGQLNIDGAVRLAKRLRPDAGSVPAGQTLVGWNGLPLPTSSVAGEWLIWDQGLIWDSGWLSGQALLTTQQQAYAQSIIWGGGLYGAGVTYGAGLFGDNYVVYGRNGQWADVAWDSGTLLGSGLLYRNATYGSGLIWDARVICGDFFVAGPSSLIWGNDSGLVWGNDSGLVWGLDSGLIWTFDQSLVWGLE
jgi:subtilisin family serine protease